MILRDLKNTTFRPVEISVVKDYQKIMFSVNGIHRFPCLSKAKNYFGKRQIIEIVDDESSRTTRIFLQG